MNFYIVEKIFFLYKNNYALFLHTLSYYYYFKMIVMLTIDWRFFEVPVQMTSWTGTC